MRKTTDEARALMVEAAMRTHEQPNERAALRCALGDAAALINTMANWIEEQHRGRGGKGAVTKQGWYIANLVRHAGDEIWAMREMVTVPALTSKDEQEEE